MASIQTLERRIAALEARLADIEGGYGDTLYKLYRHAVGTDLTVGRIAQHLGVTPPPTRKSTPPSIRSSNGGDF